MAEFNVFCHEVRALSIRTFVWEYDLNTNLFWRPYVGLDYVGLDYVGLDILAI